MAEEYIRIRGAREHNLKNIDLDIPREKLVVITGLSGSGKSSLAFDTIFAEGQRRYVESLSAYARQFLGMLEKPDVDHIDGLSPAISIDQKGASRNPRSTVGTVTEVYDYLRLLFARIGVPHCPSCGREISQQTVQQMVDTLLNLPDGTRYMILSPIVQDRKGEYRQVFEDARKAGYVRVRVDGTVYDLEETPTLDRYKQHTIEIVVDRLVNRGAETDKSRVADSLETALRLGSGVVRIVIVDGAEGARVESDVSGLRAGSSRVELQRSTDGSQEKMDSRFRGNDGEDDGSEMDSSPVSGTGQAFRGNDGAETEGEIDSRLGRNDGDAAEGEMQSRPAQSIGQALGGNDGEGPERLADDIPNPSDRHSDDSRNPSNRHSDDSRNPSNRHSDESRNTSDRLADEIRIHPIVTPAIAEIQSPTVIPAKARPLRGRGIQWSCSSRSNSPAYTVASLSAKWSRARFPLIVPTARARSAPESARPWCSTRTSSCRTSGSRLWRAPFCRGRGSSPRIPTSTRW